MTLSGTGKLPRDLLNNWTVVVVDDDPLSLTVASTILSFYGAKVHKAMDGDEALSVIRRVQPGFIISDLSMPGMDGWALIAELKKDRTTIDIPVIALTAHAMMGDRQKAIAAGFHNYLTKPLTPATFIKDLLKLLVDIPELKITLPD